MGEKIYLDRGWLFADHYSDEMAGKPMDEGVLVSVPHTVKETPFHYFDEGIYQKVSCYQKMIYDDPSFEGKRIVLTFEGAAHEAHVFLNGESLGVHRSGYTAFSFDISDKLIPEKDNLLTVRLDSRENLNQPPFGFVIDYMTYGGIYRDVYLDISEKEGIEDIFYIPLFTVPPDTSRMKLKELIEYKLPGELKTEISLTDEAKKAASDEKLTIRQYLDGNLISDQPLSKDGHSMTLAGDVFLWDIHSPHRYLVRTEILVDGIIKDFDERYIGFRTAVFKKEGFFLNGRYVKIRGLNRHQSYPYFGYAAPESLQRYDAVLLKDELGLNAVRTSHYPQSHYFIDECDKKGLLVFTEFPGWQHIGDKAWKDIAVSNVKEMITEYRNHPSIILWGVRINESVDDDEFYTRTNALAHKLDSTRQTGGVRCNKKMSLLEDVYTYNDFSHTGNNPGCEPKENVTPDMDKAYFVSEYNGHMFPTKPYDSEEHMRDHLIRHAAVLDSVASHRDIAGSFGWCMFDYNTHKDFGSGDRICYHGVMDMFRNEKPAAYIYAAQSEKKPVLFVTSSMDIGEHPASIRGDIYIISNADSVKMYRNGEFIKEYFPKDSSFRHLKHGPVRIDDFVGDALIKNEGFSKRKSDLAKACLNYAALYGYDFSPSVKMKAAKLLSIYRMTQDDAVALYEKYIGNWGGKADVFKFEAIKNGKVVKTVTKTPVTKAHLEAISSSSVLTESNTYDMAMIRVRAVDDEGNRLPFMNDPVSISVEGPLETAGPSITSLNGGAGGFFVKTKGEAGTAKVTIRSDYAGEAVLEFSITV